MINTVFLISSQQNVFGLAGWPFARIRLDGPDFSGIILVTIMQSIAFTKCVLRWFSF